MIGSFYISRKRAWIIAAVGALLIGILFKTLYTNKPSAIPRVPTVPVVSQCKPLSPGFRRLGDPSGLLFDALTDKYMITEGTQDMPPFAHGFVLKPQSSAAIMTISYGAQPLGAGAPPETTTVFSEHYEKRFVFDEKGQQIGEDDWGYLNSRKFWRHIHFHGFVYVKYDFVAKSDAELFDQIINTACRM